MTLLLWQSLIIPYTDDGDAMVVPDAVILSRHNKTVRHMPLV